MSTEQDPEPEDRLGMTEEQWAWFKAHTSGYGEQDVNGIDLSQLRRNRKLTPTERVRRLERAIQADLEIRRAGAAHRLRKAGRLPGTG